MKYVIVPIIKTIMLLFYLLIIVPVTSALNLLVWIWEGNTKFNMFEDNFCHQDAFGDVLTEMQAERSGKPVECAYYKTCWDWYFDRKSYYTVYPRDYPKKQICYSDDKTECDCPGLCRNK